MSRTALLIRYSYDDAVIVHDRAAAEQRTISGYLLHVLEHSTWIEEKYGAAFTSEPASRMHKRNQPVAVAETATLLRCSSEQAAAIRKAAGRRRMSISRFVRFSLHRHWRTAKQVSEELKIF